MLARVINRSSVEAILREMDMIKSTESFRDFENSKNWRRLDFMAGGKISGFTVKQYEGVQMSDYLPTNVSGLNIHIVEERAYGIGYNTEFRVLLQLDKPMMKNVVQNYLTSPLPTSLFEKH